jgi:ATP-binding cassette, subfamily F, member 3
MNNIEKTIARLDQQKKLANDRLMLATDASVALESHNELEDLTRQLGVAEERWCALLEELSAFD